MYTGTRLAFLNSKKSGAGLSTGELLDVLGNGEGGVLWGFSFSDAMRPWKEQTSEAGGLEE